MKANSGNPNPSPATRFKKGVAQNPNGKTSEQRRLEVANAARATRIREKLLIAAETAMEGGANLAMIEAAMLKLIKDSEDRGLGSPVSPMEHTGKDGEPLGFAAATMAALARKHDA